MSNDENARLLERAAALLDEITGHPSKYDRLLEIALTRNDLDAVRYAVSRIESELSRDNFNNYDLFVF